MLEIVGCAQCGFVFLILFLIDFDKCYRGRSSGEDECVPDDAMTVWVLLWRHQESTLEGIERPFSL